MAAPALKQAKDTFNGLKRKATGSSTPESVKKIARKKPKSSSRVDSESVAESSIIDVPSFSANVVPRSYKPKTGEIIKTFDEVADKQSLVSQAHSFYKDGSRICISSGKEWDAMARYKTAVWMGTNFSIGDDVLVMQTETDDTKSGLAPDLQGRWVGRIMEIRAIDQSNVFILINWYNRPEDLPKGRQPHHSMNEIVVTNDVDVILPSTLVGTLEVAHWVESDDTAPPDRQIFWRQCVAMEDPSKGGLKFSKLKSVCTCKEPANVDKTLVNCSNCDLWLHDECIIKDLAKSEGVPEKKWKRLVERDEDGEFPEVLPCKFRLSPSKRSPWVVDMDTERGIFVSKDKEKDGWEGKMNCLGCGAWLK